MKFHSAIVIQDFCKECPEGYYCDSTLQNDTFCSHGVQNPQACPQGYYCLNGTSLAQEYGCPVGTFNDRLYLKTAAECTNCIAGQFCGSEGLESPTGPCLAGFYCTSGASISTPRDGVTGDVCERGGYCPTGSNTTTLCPPGTYNTVEGLEDLVQCTGCEPGMFCAGFGNVYPDGNCSSRYYCAGNATTASPTDGITGDECPVANYCPMGSPQPVPCEPGTYTITTLNEECLPCTSGHYCITGGPPDDCPAGYYCPEGTGYVWEPCPTGTYSPDTGLANDTQCTPCDGGFYCDALNATTITAPCQEGYYCRSGSDTMTPSPSSKGDAGECPMGYYCPTQTADPAACPAGYFNNQTGIVSVDQCQLCLDGHYCETPGLAYPSGLCAEGFYCTGGSNSSQPDASSSTGGPCSVGTYCTLGSSLPVDCSAGTYNPIDLQSACLDCPPGYYCEAAASNITDCPRGKLYSMSAC